MPNRETRRLAIRRLKADTFDVLILGGGINGAGIARDLALRIQHSGVRLRVALIEQQHFASGTSGRNSQLIHGGLRYLKNFEFGLVREALRERAILRRLAPDLVEPLAFLMPLYGRFARWFYGAGLTLYDALAGSHNIGRHRAMSRDTLLGLEPGLRTGGLCCGLEFWDCRVNSARFVLANVFDAAERGVAVANYIRGAAWTRAGDAWCVELVDTLTGERFEARVRKLIDTTGPWSSAGALRLVRGSHIVLPRLTASDRAVAWFEPGGRIVFVIPWGERSNLSLIGTTDVDHAGGPGSVRISSEEIQYLHSIVKTLYPRASSLEPISTYSSLRPLLRDESAAPAGASREHRIWNGPDGVLHVAGGKYTTYRAMSEEAADLAMSELQPRLREVHLTAATALPSIARPAGGEAERMAHAANFEMVERLADLMFVSTYWGYERRWDRASLSPYAQELARSLGWNERRIKEEIDSVLCALSVSERG